MDRENITNILELHDPYFDRSKLDKALDLAVAHRRVHHNQELASFYNPLEIATIVLGMHLDTSSVIAAVLCEVMEDHNLTLETIEPVFGPEVAALISGVKRLSKLEFLPSNLNQVENFRKLLLALSNDIRIILIKLVDRLYNIRMIDFIECPKQQLKIAIETMEVYVPLAERMGVQKIKTELQDTCFKILHPKIRDSIVRRLEAMAGFDDHQLMDKIIDDLQNTMLKSSVKSEVQSRRKTPYSVWIKMQQKNISLEELSDIIGFRIIVATVAECYRVLEIIHQVYHVWTEQFDDFISLPKHNGYKSLHTIITIFGNQKIEIQIRTQEMHKVAELGIAAHWQYKQKNYCSPDNNYYKAIHEMINQLEKSKNLEDFLHNTKLEMYYDEVFCFTPKGRLVDLPKGSTPIDFAYAVNPNIGNHCIGAKVNDCLVPLGSVLKNCDLVEIITAKNQERITFLPPKKDLPLATTAKAAETIIAPPALLAPWIYNSIQPTLISRVLQKFNLSKLKFCKTSSSAGTASEPGESANLSSLLQNQLLLTSKPANDHLPIINTDQVVSPLENQTIREVITATNKIVEADWNSHPGHVSVACSLNIIMINQPDNLLTLCSAILKQQAKISGLTIVKCQENYCEIIVNIQAYSLEHIDYLINNLQNNRAIYQVKRQS